MATFILTWNPDVWREGEEWLDSSAGTASSEAPVPGDWSVGTRRGGIELGDRALLLRQRRDRGIVASGVFTSGVYQADHWDGSDRVVNNADIDFDRIVTLEDRLVTDELKAAVPQVAWDRLQGSGVRVPDNAEAVLLELWDAHSDVGPNAAIYPDDVLPTYPEGSLRTIKVNRYERSRKARDACLRHHGTACTICGFDFQVAFGILGGRGIHVHHLRELSEIGEDYQVDPVKDLIPVCPNCHAALHSVRPALLPEALRKAVAALR